jgi:GntR family transcriptional regulator
MTPARTIFAASRLVKDSNAPLYLRIKRLVQESVTTGDLQQGEAIPSERDIAELLDVSRVTVRKAFSELVGDGVLVQRRGSGTFVRGHSGRLEQPLSRLTSFSEDMKLRGLKTDADWLDRSTALPTPEEAMKLSISPSDHVCRFHRLRRANGVPLAIEYAVVPHRFLEDPDQVTDSLYQALANRGHQPIRALQRLHATALSDREAQLLVLPAGSPALFIERVSYLSDGRIVEYTRSHYRGDTYDFVAELTLAQDPRP